ncbi:Berberine bridge enzyme-like 8 [Bienertia sinuspersici]
MKIRSGGHDYEGLSYVSNTPFFILDMFNLRSIQVNLEDETAWVQTGATLGEVFYNIAKKSKVHGFPAGVCPTVGVGGHVSGAGYGNMMRKYGLTSDNVIDAEIVDADGRVLNRKTMGDDLFWAIRGGGGSSFGVIVSYKIKLVRVPQVVTVFRVSRTMEENAIDVVLQWQDIASKIDDNLFIRLAMDVIDQGNNKRLKKLDCHELCWIESVLFWADYSPIDTPIEVLLERTPPTLSHLTRKSDYVKDPIPKEGLEIIWKKMIELETPRLIFNPYGGKMSEISEDAIPFPHRKGNLYKIQYLANWDEEGKEKEKYYMELVRKLYSYMSPYVSKYPRQAYYNYRDLDLGVNHHDGTKGYLEGRKYGIQYFMNNFDKLVHIKTLVDPSNLFRNEQSIPILPM